MKYLLFTICVIFSINIISCGKDKEQEATSEIEKVNEHIETRNQQTADKIKPDVDEEKEILNYKKKEQKENEPPIIKTIFVETITNNPRDGFRTKIDASDPEGDTISFIYQWKLNDEDIPGETNETLFWNDNFKRGDKLTVEIIPFDNEAQGKWKSEGSIEIPNSPPSIISEPISEVENGKFSYDIVTDDPDGDDINITINNKPEGMNFDPEKSRIIWEFNEEDFGTYDVEIVVTDEYGAATFQELNLVIGLNQ